MTTDTDIVVIGGGVVGLAVGWAMGRRGRSATVLERHSRIGSEISSRSSEVIHAGLYYPPGSQRARLCVAGKRLLYEFCRDAGVSAHPCGKLLVATAEDELPQLDAIAETARRNGVTDLVRLTANEARALEPDLACVAALLSPSTGVIDSHGLMVALDGHIAAGGGSVVLNTEATGIRLLADRTFAVAYRDGERTERLTANAIVIAAGLGATDIANTVPWPGDYLPPRTYPAKGHYFALTGRAPFRHLVYPMPQGAWLGVHLTLDTSGRAKFGPDIEWVETVDYTFDGAGGSRQARFEAEIRRYWPGLPHGALHPDYTGIRPKLYRFGEPAADFAVHGEAQHGVPGLVALYGIESPGLTSSLAIGAHVADLLAEPAA